MKIGFGATVTGYTETLASMRSTSRDDQWAGARAINFVNSAFQAPFAKHILSDAVTPKVTIQMKPLTSGQGDVFVEMKKTGQQNGQISFTINKASIATRPGAAKFVGDVLNSALQVQNVKPTPPQGIIDYQVPMPKFNAEKDMR